MLQETRLGGYRVLRGLGSGERAEVLLGAGGEEPVAIKRFLPHVALDRVLVELDAIERIDAPHLPRVLDLASGPDGAPVLVLERWSPFTLGALLARRRTISAGEAVTLLAPIAETVERMHAAGFAHGALGTGAVHLALDGAPVLGGLGSLARFAPAGASEAVRHDAPAIAEDARALTALAAALAQHLDASGAELRRRLDELAGGGVPEPQRRAFELLETLFGTAPAEAVRFPGSGRRAAGESPIGATPRAVAASAEAPAEESTAAPRSAGPIGWLAAAQLPEWLERLVDAQGSAVQRSAPLRRLRESLSSIRPRFRVLGGVTVLALLALGGFVLDRASGDSASYAAPPAGESSTAESTTGQDPVAGGEEGPAVAAEGHDDPVDGGASDDGALQDDAASPVDAAVRGDDPLAAAEALLAERDACLLRAEHACLDDVVQAGSALLREDRHRIDATQREDAPAEQLGAPAELRVVQELGGAVLLAASFPEAVPQTTAASLLIVRSEAGWRLRDLL